MSDLIEDLLEGKIKGRAAKLSRIQKITKNAPEVMVKITGYSKGTQHMQAHLNYIGREGTLELEDQDGSILQTKDEVKNLINSITLSLYNSAQS